MTSTPERELNAYLAAHADRDGSEVPAGPPLHEPTDRDADNVPSGQCPHEAVEAVCPDPCGCSCGRAPCRTSADKVTSDRVRAYAEAIRTADNEALEYSNLQVLGATYDQQACAVMAVADREQASAWDEGFAAAEIMARSYGHTDHWTDEDVPANPYHTVPEPTEETS